MPTKSKLSYYQLCNKIQIPKWPLRTEGLIVWRIGLPPTKLVVAPMWFTETLVQ